MARSIYILCDDCHKEYCVSVINKNKGFRQTSYLAEAEFEITVVFFVSGMIFSSFFLLKKK